MPSKSQVVQTLREATDKGKSHGMTIEGRATEEYGGIRFCLPILQPPRIEVERKPVNSHYTPINK